MTGTAQQERPRPQLKSRPPTCVVPWPLILVEGGEKSGKSWLFAQLTASERVGRCEWLDVGEGSADEYGDAITGEVTYGVIEHDGSWTSIIRQVEAAWWEAHDAQERGDLPFCLGLDSVTLLWEMLKDWGSARAMESESAQRRLAADPNAEIKIPNHIWNDVNARWAKLMRLLMTFPGIAVVTARGKETAKIEKGKPVEGETAYKVEAQKNLQFDATVWLRVSRDAAPVIVGCRSKHLRVRYGRDEGRVLETDATLEQLIFEGLRCGTGSQPRQLVPLGGERLPEVVRDEAIAARHGHDRDRLLELLAEAAGPGLVESFVVNEEGEDEPLHELVMRYGREITGRAQPAQQQQPNRFAKLKADREAQDVPAAPAPVRTPTDPAAPELLERLNAVLTACGLSPGAQQLAVCASLIGRQLGGQATLTGSEAVRIGRLAEDVLATAGRDQLAPIDVMRKRVEEILNNRAAAAQTRDGKAA